jgi:hypothetical protein
MEERQPEPLKDKEGFVDEWQIRDKKDVHPSHLTKVFEEEDIKSAVEWLKDQLPDIEEKETIRNLINDAFEDVKDGK